MSARSGFNGGKGPWQITFICCGRDDGTWRCQTWEEADALRDPYVAAPDHERSAIISRVPVGAVVGQEEHSEPGG